jgi:hypothetical protein
MQRGPTPQSISMVSLDNTTDRDRATSPRNPFSTPDPFATPQYRPSSAATSGISSARELSNIQRNKYYHSRRIRKDDGYVPQKFKKDPKEKWLWIVPLCGLLVGLGISGVLVYLTVNFKSYKYCPVLDEDFSSGQLNPRVWTKEVEVGGFGYGLAFPIPPIPSQLPMQKWH